MLVRLLLGLGSVRVSVRIPLVLGLGLVFRVSVRIRATS